MSDSTDKPDMSGIVAYVVALAVFAALTGGAYWLVHPPLSVNSEGTWLFIALVFVLLFLALLVAHQFVVNRSDGYYDYFDRHKYHGLAGVAMLGANVLGIKPSIVMVDGKLQVGKKYRGKLENCQMQYVRDLLEQYAGRIDTDRAFLSRTAGVSDEQMKALQKEIHKTLKFKEYIVSTVGCTITSHCGERTFTFEFMLK